LPSTITILTPENVEVTYELAGLASRIRGAAVDSILQLVALVSVWTVIGTVASLSAAAALQNWLIALGILLTFVILVGYFLVFETRWNGQTPGKRLTGTRVMKDAGFPIDLRAAVIRNLVRLIDLLPGIYAVGFASAFFSAEYKRLGDFAAGTVVVRERPRAAPLLAPPAIESPAGAAATPAPGARSARGPRADELHAIRHFLDRRADLAPETRGTYARRLALAFGRLYDYPLDQVAAAPEAFLQWLTDEAARRQGAL
jgi:uncharacterized RDD family membrane protein YckC